MWYYIGHTQYQVTFICKLETWLVKQVISFWDRYHDRRQLVTAEIAGIEYFTPPHSRELIICNVKISDAKWGN